MVFRTKKQLNDYIMIAMEKAIKETQEKIYFILYKFINQFYEEFTPSEYERIFELYKALVKSEIIKSGKSYKAIVYFDATQMDHQILDGYYGQEREPSGWSEDKILETALINDHPHGGYSRAPGQGIMINAMPVLKEEALNWLLTELNNNGVPVKK